MKTIKKAEYVLCTIRVFIVLLSVLALTISGMRWTRRTLNFDDGTSETYITDETGATIFDRMNGLDICFLVTMVLMIVFCVLTLALTDKRMKKIMIRVNIVSMFLSAIIAFLGWGVMNENHLGDFEIREEYIGEIRVVERTFWDLELRPTYIGCVLVLCLSALILALEIVMERQSCANDAIASCEEDQTQHKRLQKSFADWLLGVLRTLMAVASALLLVMPGYEERTVTCRDSSGEVYDTFFHTYTSNTIYRMELWDIVLFIVAGMVIVFGILTLIPRYRKVKVFMLVGNIIFTVLSVGMVVVGIIVMCNSSYLHVEQDTSFYPEIMTKTWHSVYHYTLWPFLVSSILTVGMSVASLVLSDKPKRPARVMKCYIVGEEGVSPVQNTSASGSVTTPSDNDVLFFRELNALQKLLDSGIITQEEFDAKKKQILGL